MKDSRRRLLKVLGASGGVVVAATLPKNWSTPVVESVVLPAHAQTTEPDDESGQPRRQCCVIEALIDGRSQLVIQGDAVRWDHFEFSAPGLHEQQDLPTVLCGEDWFPVWPGGQFVDCSNCTSLSVNGLVPGLATRDQTVQLEELQARNSVQVAQQPNSGNGYTLIVEFNDTDGGSEIYRIRLCYF